MIKKILLWMLSGLLLICGLAFMPSISSILFLAVAILLLPVNKLQNVLKNVFPRKKLKGILCAVLAVIAIIASPTDTPTNNAELPAQSGSSQVIQGDLDSELPEHDVSASTEPNDQQNAVILPAEENLNEKVDPPQGSSPEASSTPTDDTQDATTAPQEPEQTPGAGAAIPLESTFEVHFIDVGQADAALVLCDGHAMLIDGGNSGDSSLIYSYLKNHEISYLDVVVATHGHEDHVGGLSGALNFASVGKAYCSVTSYDSDAFNDFVKYLGKHDTTITVPKPGDTFQLGSADVQIVGVDGNAADHNNSSIVLRIEYGETSFLFTGDAEREAEQTILSSVYEIESTVLKVGHHGSDSSTSYVFLREVAPQYGVISVGEGNSYGHPTEDALSRLRDADVTVYRTDLQGTIVCTSDGENVSFSVSKNKDADTLAPPSKTQSTVVTPTIPTPPAQTDDSGDEDTGSVTVTDYVGNKNTKKFHYDWCGSVGKMKESNKYYYTGTRDEMIAKGYKPCGNCNP